MSDVVFPTPHPRRPIWKLANNPRMKSLFPTNRMWSCSSTNSQVSIQNRILLIFVRTFSCNPQKIQNHKFQIHTSHKRKRKHFCRRTATSYTRAIGTTTATCVHAGAILVAVQRWMETPWTIHNTAERPPIVCGNCVNCGATAHITNNSTIRM